MSDDKPDQVEMAILKRLEAIEKKLEEAVSRQTPKCAQCGGSGNYYPAYDPYHPRPCDACNGKGF
jgi:DnaJ-class molecular chaperone